VSGWVEGFNPDNDTYVMSWPGGVSVDKGKIRARVNQPTESLRVDVLEAYAGIGPPLLAIVRGGQVMMNLMALAMMKQHGTAYNHPEFDADERSCHVQDLLLVLHCLYLSSYVISYVGRDYSVTDSRAAAWLLIALTPLPVIASMIFLGPSMIAR
jgi:hypothetical protein